MALIVSDIDSEAGQQAGAIELRTMHSTGEIAGFGFRCPCGCGREGYLPVRGLCTARQQTPEWEWDGNQIQPTLHPSVLQVGGCEWHGWLRDGEWMTA